MAKLPLLNKIISLKQKKPKKKKTLKSSMSGYSRAFLVFSALFLLLATQAPVHKEKKYSHEYSPDINNSV